MSGIMGEGSGSINGYNGGDLVRAFTEADSEALSWRTPLLLGVVRNEEGHDIYYVHEVRMFGLASDRISTYNQREFFQEYGHPSQMMTLDQHDQELQAINGLRKQAMQQAVDMHNDAIDAGTVSANKINSEPFDFSRLDKELYTSLRANDFPARLAAQINASIDQSRKIGFLGDRMLARANNVERDVASYEGCLPAFKGLHGHQRMFSAELVQVSNMSAPEETMKVVH